MADHPHSLILQQPEAAPAQALILLFHGVGADAADLAPLGLRLGEQFPQAWVVSVGGLDPADAGGGRQWFSLRGLSEANRVDRVDAAMPRFVETVADWQARSGVGPAGTALIGFSQGAIMALESTRGRPALGGRVVALAGRYAVLPETANPDTTVHLLHGKHDAVMPYAHTVQAAERLVALGGDVTADVLPFIGHEVHEELVELLLERLTTYIPRRVWDLAMRAARQGESTTGHPPTSP